MANLRKNEYVFIFARFSAFMVLRAPFAPPPLKWPVATSHCGRLTATLPTPKINGPMDDEVHFFFACATRMWHTHCKKEHGGVVNKVGGKTPRGCGGRPAKPTECIS
jgi:hypothetical protein